MQYKSLVGLSALLAFGCGEKPSSSDVAIAETAIKETISADPHIGLLPLSPGGSHIEPVEDDNFSKIIVKAKHGQTHIEVAAYIWNRDLDHVRDVFEYGKQLEGYEIMMPEVFMVSSIKISNGANGLHYIHDIVSGNVSISGDLNGKIFDLASLNDDRTSIYSDPNQAFALMTRIIHQGQNVETALDSPYETPSSNRDMILYKLVLDKDGNFSSVFLLPDISTEYDAILDSLSQ